MASIFTSSALRRATVRAVASADSALRTPGLRAGMGRLQRGRVELVEHWPALTCGAFGEQPLLEDAADLRPDLGDDGGRGAARQLGAQRQRLVLERDGADFPFRRGGPCLGRGGLAVARAAGERDGGGQREGGREQREGTRV